MISWNIVLLWINFWFKSHGVVIPLEQHLWFESYFDKDTKLTTKLIIGVPVSFRWNANRDIHCYNIQSTIEEFVGFSQVMYSCIPKRSLDSINSSFHLKDSPSNFLDFYLDTCSLTAWRICSVVWKRPLSMGENWETLYSWDWTIELKYRSHILYPFLIS